MRFWGLQPDNPILRAEIAYQRRTIPRWLQWFDRFGVVVAALGVAVGLLYLPTVHNSYGAAASSDRLFDVLLPLLWISQLVVILRCLIGGYTSIRSQGGQQWDVLTLTGISVRRLFVGKWWAVLYQLHGWLLALGFIKLAVGTVVIINLIVFCYRAPLESIIRTVDYYSHGPRPVIESALLQLPYMIPALPSVDRIAVTGVHTVIVAVLEILASTAISITGGMISQKIIGLASIVVLRFAPMITFTFLPDYSYASRISIHSMLRRWDEYTWFSFADGGSTAILRAGIMGRGSVTVSEDRLMTSILLAFYAAIAMYFAYLLFSLTISYILLRRQGLLSAGSK